MTATAWLIIRTAIGAAVSFYNAAAATVFLQSFYDNGIRWSRKKAAILGVYVLAEALMSIFIPDDFILTGLFMLVMYIAIPILGCKGKVISRAFKVILTYSVSTMTVSTVSLFGFVYLMPGFNVNSENLSQKEELATNLICLLVFAFAFHYIKIKLIDKDIFVRCGKKENIAVVLYSIFTFCMFVLATIPKEEPELTGGVLVIFAMVCLGAMTAFPLVLFHGRISAHYRQANELHESYMQSQLEHFRQYRAAQEETARFRHDIKNNLQCISDLLASGKEKEAGEYVTELLCEVRALSPEYVSGDEILDCIVSSKASVMKREGIEFVFDGVIPGGLGFAAIDVCNVFANALDNAIESCLKMPEGKRYIKMALKSSEQFRYVCIENSAAEKVDVSKLFAESGGYTTKVQSKGHGMGTYSIRRTAEKYGGVVKAESREGAFVLEIIINKNSDLNTTHDR